MEKIKVLLFAANPRGTGPLDLARANSARSTRKYAWAHSGARPGLILVPGTRPVDLLRKLNENQPQVVHFSSHGSPDAIILESGEGEASGPDVPGIRSADERDMKKVGPEEVAVVGFGQGEPQVVSKTALVNVLRSCNEGNLRLVVLNACSTRAHAEVLTEVVDCVVSMNQTITDRAAIKFAASFYGALAFGRSVDKAFEQGVARLSMEGIAESDTPELLVRAGVDASHIVLVSSVASDGGGSAAGYFTVQREAIEEHVRRFIGRVAVSKALDRFLARHSRGYFVIRGAPGQGKSAVACHLINSRGWAHHLINRTGGRSDARLILRSVIAQLAPRMEPDRSLPDSIPELAKAFEDLLARSAARAGRLVLVVDALDELSEDAGPDPPFLVTEGLPANVYVIVTARPGDRLDQLLEALHSTPHELYDLGPLEAHEVGTILRAGRPDFDDAMIALAGKASKGNPLFLRAVADALERDPDYDLRDLPSSIEGFFRRALGGLNGRRDPLLTEVLGLLAAALKPLSLRELAQITGTAFQREIHEKGIRHIRQFLVNVDEGYSFYHARFHEFITHELLYEDELPHFHAKLATWLRRPECLTSNYRYIALAHHLDRAGDRDGLWATVEPGFLREKIRRFDYSALEDVALLARDAIETGDPSRVERCIELVEGLRQVAGGDLIDEARRTIQGRRLVATATRNRIETPEPPHVSGMEVYIGMLPKSTVGADFVEAARTTDGLLLALGDAPGVGLKGAFVARFVGGLVRRLAKRPGALRLDELLEDVDRILAPHPFFDMVSLQCVVVNSSTGTLAIAGAGHPHPVLYSPRRGRCDRLPVGDDLLLARMRCGGPSARRRERHFEIYPGDVLIMVCDGLTEAHGMTAEPYGYRFERLIPALCHHGPRAIGEAIIGDWLVHSDGSDYMDDVTVVVVAMNDNGPTQAPLEK